ncbi:MAG TPA: dockerin type I domain-containing protein, partial [Candidatus Dormibacteraeota bacterium]|nr:dockerin type I domain-containing protein [Candidatus Dormibacteraeota bacterium]
LFVVGIGVKKGDVNMDGTVDIVDLATVAQSYGTSYGQPNYNPYADVSMHGAVNIQDLAAVAYNYGQTY